MKLTHSFVSQIAKHFVPMLTTVVLTAQLTAQDLPYKEEILNKMLLANQYFMNKWPDPGLNIVTDKVRPSNIWTRSTYYEGLMALYYIHPVQEFYDYAVNWGESHSWEPAYGGITLNADNQCCGQTYIELYQLDPQPERIQSIKTSIDSMVKRPQSDDWWWVDALQMAMPVFAKLGVVLDDTAYYEKMFDLYNDTKTIQGTSGLYNPADHLWWRDKDFDPPYTTPDGKNCYWSRGNGWVFAALARVLDVLPANAPHREEYVTTFKEMAEALIGVQRYDGFWNPSLVDSNDYGGEETSGTAFFTFGLAWGVNDSLLHGEVYKPYVVKAWNGMVKDALHPNGFLGYMQGTGKQPSDGQPLSYDKVPNFEDFGLGAFLLAGSEVYKMATTSPDTIPSSVPSVNKEEMDHLQVFPNPFQDIIHISCNLPEDLKFEMAIYDLYGKRIRDCRNELNQYQGNQQFTWNGKDDKGHPVPSGIYILQFKTDRDVLTRAISRM
jgi:unsaturated rhamnogalacturonyl hydrolase